MQAPAKRIMSLKDPTAKMSKSHNDPNSRILITDSPDDIEIKIKGALTDSIEGVSYDPSTRPGVSNLVEILKHVSNNEASPEEIASDLQGLTMRAFKEHVAKQIIISLDGIRDRFLEYSQPGNATLEATRKSGHEVATSRSGIVLRAVQSLIGLRDPITHTGVYPARGSEVKNPLQRRSASHSKHHSRG